jgi:hypothetical protein
LRVAAWSTSKARWTASGAWLARRFCQFVIIGKADVRAAVVGAEALSRAVVWSTSKAPLRAASSR